jgi:transposase
VAPAPTDIVLLSPDRKTRRRPSFNDGRMMRRYRKRSKVDRTLGWLGNFRRQVVRYDYRLDMYRAFFQLACALITLRLLAK